MRFHRILLAFVALLTVAGCSESLDPAGSPADEFGPNPFLDSTDPGKEDTGYVNPRGVEIEVTIEANIDVGTSTWRIFDGPADLAQYAVTYLRKRDIIYLELLAEDASANDRVEWRVGDEWLTRAQLGDTSRDQLTHFRLTGVNAVVLNPSGEIPVGQVYEATVPVRPYAVFSEAGEDCADYNSHIDLSQSVYWYLWNPRRSSCELDTQTMSFTVSAVMPNNPDSYPEYDQLLADNRLEIVILFAKLDDGDVADDYNWDNVRKMSEWLVEAGFTEDAEAPLGRRFTKVVGELTEVVDIYGPDLFHSVADRTRFRNWQTAVTEHEVVMYNGHSVLGTGYAFEEVDYPEHYQIFQVASCLSYEYYVRPILAGKGDWTSVDVLSNTHPTYYSENLPLTSTLVARLIFGAENGGSASWQDIMESISRRLGHSRFGVSGARDNCFSPEGDRCGSGPDPDPNEVRYDNATPLEIPDNDAAGASSVIEVGEGLTIGTLKVEVDLTHTWVGDLRLTLTHGDVSTVLWDRTGGSDDDIRVTFRNTDFNGVDASGEWTLHVSDNANRDVGTLNNWALIFTP